MPKLTKTLIKTAIVAFVVSVLLALIGGLAIGRRVTIEPISPSNEGYRPLILSEVETHEVTLGIPFVLTVTFVRAPYDLRLKVIDQDLSTTRITADRVEIKTSDSRSRTDTPSITAKTTDYRHDYIDDAGIHQTKPAKMATLTLPASFPSAGEFTVRVVGTRLTASGEATPFSMEAKIRMRNETVVTTHRGLVTLGSI